MILKKIKVTLVLLLNTSILYFLKNSNNINKANATNSVYANTIQL